MENSESISPRQQMISILENQPEDSSYDELLRELEMVRQINLGLKDVDEGRVKSHEEVGQIIQSWQN